MRNLFYLAVIFVAGLGLASPVFALTISPAKFEITGDPGQTLNGEINLYNEQEGSKTFFSSFENFEPKGDTGSPYFVGAKDDLATWLRTEEQITIKQGERIKVPFSMVIPKDAEPGGHFAAIFFGTQPPGAGGGEVSIGGKIGMLILLRVSGYVPEGGGLAQFSSKEKHKFLSALPITFAYRFNNTGGDRVVPLGEIKIKNTFRMVSDSLPANKNEGSVLPNSTRKFEAVWGSESKDENTGFFHMAAKEWRDFHFGWYTAQINLSWGLTNQKANGAYNFFIIPWQLGISLFLSAQVSPHSKNITALS
jgi:hypothetical protein